MGNFIMLNLFVAILLSNFMEARNSIELDIMQNKMELKEKKKQYYLNMNTDNIEAHYEAEMADKKKTKTM
jgi:hypothetical protein